MIDLNNSPCKLKLTFLLRARNWEIPEEFKDSSKELSTKSIEDHHQKSPRRYEIQRP
jgi:hypothetical protein